MEDILEVGGGGEARQSRKETPILRWPQGCRKKEEEGEPAKPAKGGGSNLAAPSLFRRRRGGEREEGLKWPRWRFRMQERERM